MLTKKHLFIVVGLFVVLCVAYLLLVTLPRQGKVEIEILAHPEKADIFIDDKKSKSGTVYLAPGLHTFKAKEDGWKADEVTLTVSENSERVALLPTPESDEAKQLADKEAIIREGLYGVAADARGFDIRNKYPVLSSLPYSDIAGPFKIDYGFSQEDNKTPYLIVSYSTPNGRKKALDWLKEKKTDISMVEIIFEDFINPIHTEKHDV